jgi:UDP-N-acetylglucosamine--N-acetylmuramyl-(pentapeptide) pyrophosphoryl-undecaprenol N-acetylglucosamine transferase
MKRLIVAGGGTGGHVLAGVAIADCWKSEAGEQKSDSVLFIGAESGIEARLVPKAGYRLETLSIGSLNRVGLARRLKTLIQLPVAFLRSFRLLREFRPDAVIGVGGYSSGPVVLTASVLARFGFLNARTAILEQNAVPGLTNRILGRFVDQVFCAYETSRAQFGLEKSILSGNPVRAAMQPMPPSVEEPLQIFVFGGSQGALGMNTLVIGALPLLSDLSERIQWLHQTGEKDFERVKSAHEAHGTRARVEKFIDRMDLAYQRTSLVICRAGSSTLSELAAVGRAAILVPLPTAADNHQEVNARQLEKSQAALVFRQQEGSPEALAKLIRECLSEPGNLRAMEKSVSKFYRPQAAQEVSRFLALPRS